MHTHETDNTEGVLVRSSRAYDLVLGRVIRRTDSRIIDLAQVGPGDHVLDVGTGPGYLARAAAARVGAAGRAVGIDASPEMIARAREVARREASPVEFTQAGAQRLPFADGSFDAAVTRLVMHHLPGDLKERALAEIVRVLKPGGRLVIADLSSHSWVERLHNAIGRAHDRGGDVDNPLAELVREAGFEDVTSGGLGWLMYVRARKPLGDSG
ncbi:MAG: class I SAM-dependent methyltransferase [Thermoleophilia bacterium]